MTWWLSHDPHPESQEGTADEDSEDARFYLMVNGERARSRRTKQVYGHVLAVRRNGDSDCRVEFIFSDNKATTADIADMDNTADFPTKDVNAFINAFSEATQSYTQLPDSQPASYQPSNSEPASYQPSNSEPASYQLSDDSDSQPSISLSQDSPLMSSTPVFQQQKRKQPNKTKNAPTKKTRRSEDHNLNESSFTVEEKCHGLFKVSVEQLTRAPDGMLSRKVSEEQITSIKDILRDNKPLQLPAIPVMAAGAWHGEVSPQDKFIVLGGYSLFTAAKDLSTDDKYSEYRQLSVLVYSNVGMDELHQVEVLYGLQASLLQDGNSSLETRVRAFREMLYRITQTDPKAEPPKPRLKVSYQWRRMCAASVGKSTERCAMKALEPTFQIAQYSVRCYEKAARIFAIQEEKGKEVKQSSFLGLQGLAEEEKYSILSSVVSGEIDFKDVKTEAARRKQVQGAKEELLRQLDVSSWEEARREYPHHTTEDVLNAYKGMDFKKSVPKTFLALVSAARNWHASGSRGSEDMQSNLHFSNSVQATTNPDLAFVNITKESDVEQVKDMEKTFVSRTVVISICDNLLSTSRVLQHIVAGGRTFSSSVLTQREGDGVKHLLASVWRADDMEEAPPRLGDILPDNKELYRNIVDRLSSINDQVLVLGSLADAALAAVMAKRRVCCIASTEDERIIRSAIQQYSLLDDDPYSYSD